MVLKVSPDVVDIGVFCCLFVVCIYILCSAGYVERPIVLSYSLYFDAWCITCYPKREETLEVYKE